MRRNLCFTCKGKRDKHAEGAWKCDQLNRAEGSRGDPPCRVKGRRPLWGLGQRPNSSTGDQYAKRAQQRCRQRSVPASNSARPQTRPQLALSINSIVSRQMGATDQHREQFVSCCWFFCCREKRTGTKNRFFTEFWGKSSLGARLRTRKVRGRDASLPAPLLAASLGLVGRGTVGALPQTPQGTLSLDPARGNCPLTPFSRLS